MPWLDRCEGYAVYVHGRHLGYVSAVHHGTSANEQPVLVVRRAGHGTAVHADQVERVDPFTARVDLRSAPSP
jgi:hypothetical protein